MSTTAMSPGGPTITSSPPRALRVGAGLDKERERKVALELRGDNGRIELHEEEEEGDEDEDAGDRRRIERWLEEQCRFGSMLGLGLDRESEVAVGHGEEGYATGGGGGGAESLGFGIGHGGVEVGGAGGGPSRADSPLLGWDTPETESVPAPQRSNLVLLPAATQPDASAPSTAYPSGVPSLSMSLSSTPSSSFTTMSSTAEVIVQGAHVKNNSNTSNHGSSPTTTTATTTTATLDGTATWGRTKTQSTASMLDSAYFHAQRPQPQQPIPTSPLPPSSPPTRRQSRVPSVSIVSSVVPPLPHSPMPLNASNSSLNLVKSRSRAGSTSLSNLASDARNAVYIDSEEVRERLDELLMRGGLEEEDELHENEHEDDEEDENEERRRVVESKERTRTPYASPYQTPEASSSQVYIGHHSRDPSAASASSSKHVSRKGSVSVPLSRKGSVLGGASGSPSISRKPSTSSPSLSRKASMSMKKPESYQPVAVGHSHSKTQSQGGSIASLREHAHAHSHSRSHNHNHSKSSASASSHPHPYPHSRAHSTTTTTHSASPSVSLSLSSIAASASAPASASVSASALTPIPAPASAPVVAHIPSTPLSVPVPIQLPTQAGPRPTRPPPAPPLDLALVGNLVLAAVSTDVEGVRDDVGRDTNVKVEGLGENGAAARLNVEADETQRYSSADVDVGLFPVPPAHIPFASPPTPLSPPLALNGEGEEEGVVRPRAEGVGARHAPGMTSRWSLASSIDEAEGATDGKKNGKEKEKEKEKRKSFVAFVAAVAGTSSADSGVSAVGAGGLDMPGNGSGSGENLTLSKDKDPKEKKRGRLASFISRLSYSGGANALVSSVSEIPPLPPMPMPTPTTPPASPTLAKMPTSTSTKSQYSTQYKQQYQQPPPLMQRLAAMAFDDSIPPHHNPGQSQSQSGLLPSPEIRSGNPGLGSRRSDDHIDANVDANADVLSSIKTREVKGVWEPIPVVDDGAPLPAPPPSPPPKLRARSNSAADLLSSSRMVAQVHPDAQRHQQQYQHQQQQQQWPQQYADVDERDIMPPPPPHPGMRGRSNSAADLLGLGLAGANREMGGYGYDSQQYQRPPLLHSHSQAAPFFHNPTSSFDAELPSPMYTRPPLHKSASASILRSTPSPLGLGHGHTTPRMPSRPPPPPPKSKAMMMRIQTGFRGVDAAASPVSPVSPGSVPLTTMLGQGPASGGNDKEDEGVVARDEEAVEAVEHEEEDDDDEEEEEDYGVVVSRPQNRMLRDHEDDRWVDESYGQHQHQQQQQYAPPSQYTPPSHTPTMSPRPSMTLTSPKFPTSSPQAMKVENALMALAPSLPSLSSPHSQQYGQQQYYHPNESSSSDGNQQQQRGLSLTTRLRSMSSLGNLHISPTSPASASTVNSAGSPPLSALSSSSPLGLPTSPAGSPSTPILGNNKENVSNKESNSKSSGAGAALTTLLLGIQKKAPKRKLVVSGVAMEDVNAYEAVKRWCEGFGQVRDISRAPNGCLYVDFKKASVAETVCRIQAQVYIKGAGSVSLDWYTKKPPV